MLRRLSGRTHTVFTGFCLFNEEKQARHVPSRDLLRPFPPPCRR
jgi:predicted house-cleaning NTP pyrophosphatase (Maf/HAM1 superfamily)